MDNDAIREHTRERVAEYRDNNAVLGIITTTITIPESDKEAYLEEAALSRAELFMEIAAGKSAKKLEILANKRSPFNALNPQHIAMLEAVSEDELRAKIKELYRHFSELTLQVSKEEDIEQLIKSKAMRVAVGFMIAAMVGIHQ